MSAVTQPNRRRRPPKIYILTSDHKVQDHLEGTIHLQRGYLCQEQEGGGERGGRVDFLWVKVVDSGTVVKLDKHVLNEISDDQAGLLEPITDPELRFRMLSKPHRLARLASLPLGSPVLVRCGQARDLADAELRYRGPLMRGSSAVYFGVQLKGSAAGRGSSNGSYKGHQLFTCPEQCALFVSVSDITPHRSSRGFGDNDPQQTELNRLNQNNHGSSHVPNPVTVLARTAESVPTNTCLPLLQVGQRVYITLDKVPQWGTVQYCGQLPGRTSSSGGVFVGVVLVCES